jgi:peptidoglycan/LPS O-acetylase OafA/YrhL
MVVIIMVNQFLLSGARPRAAALILLSLITVVALGVTYLFDQPVMSLLRGARRAATGQSRLITVPQK